MNFTFDRMTLHYAYGECCFGSLHPTKVYAAKETLAAFGEWIRSMPNLSAGWSFMGAQLEVMDKMPEGWLFFTNTEHLDKPRLHKPVMVAREWSYETVGEALQEKTK